MAQTPSTQQIFQRSKRINQCLSQATPPQAMSFASKYPPQANIPAGNVCHKQSNISRKQRSLTSMYPSKQCPPQTKSVSSNINVNKQYSPQATSPTGNVLRKQCRSQTASVTSSISVRHDKPIETSSSEFPTSGILPSSNATQPTPHPNQTIRQL